MITCPSCSTLVSKGSRFCSSCGAELHTEGEAPTKTTPSTTRGNEARDLTATTPAGWSNPNSDRTQPSNPMPQGRFIPGALLAGRYRIIGLLGRGGMGEVYRADDLKLGQPVALKFLPVGYQQDSDRLADLFQEVKLARQVSHTNVCRIYDISDDDGQHFLSMEYVDGEDLASLLRRIGRLPRDKAVEIVRQLCAGLAAAHDKGILHRDLKPSNIMIDGGGRVRITDFGLAALSDRLEGVEVRSGTPSYMAPEQIAGEEVSVRSDLYSLGLVLYELFTGKRAFEASSHREMARLQDETTPTTPSSVVDGFDPAVERVILSCLETDPMLRPATALSISAALPGGDPLAAALAAGETPSPEMVAAAGPQGGLEPIVGMVILFSILFGLVLLAWITPKVSLYGHVPMEKSAQALEENARQIVQRMGYTEPPKDRVGYFRSYTDELNYLAEIDRTSSRWEGLSEPGWSLHYFYRQSRDDLIRLDQNRRASTRVPPPRPGDVSLTLDVKGRVLNFRAKPPVADFSNAKTLGTDWTILFDAAGLDISEFKPVSATHLPQSFADERAAWTGTFRLFGKELPLRVEAASFRGRPVYFEKIVPWDDYWTAEQYEKAKAPEQSVSRMDSLQSVVGFFLLGIVVVGGSFLVSRSFRTGRGDRRGAARLAAVVFLAHLGSWLLGAHHVVGYMEFASFTLTGVFPALFFAAVSWSLYMAIEPYLRRFWAEGLVSWSRLVAGRWRDPLVGRDLLMGFLFGLGIGVVTLLTDLMPAWFGYPVRLYRGSLGVLSGGRFAVQPLVDALEIGLTFALSFTLIYLLVRLILRRTWLAALVYVLLFSLVRFPEYLSYELDQPAIPKLLVVFAALSGLSVMVLTTLVILRFGLLATVGSFVFLTFIRRYPFTTDSSAPYFTMSLMALIAAAAAATVAYRICQSGRAIPAAAANTK